MRYSLGAVLWRPTCFGTLHMHVHVLYPNQQWLVLWVCDQLSHELDEQDVTLLKYGCIVHIWTNNVTFCCMLGVTEAQSSCCRTDFLVTLSSNNLQFETLASCLLLTELLWLCDVWPAPNWQCHVVSKQWVAEEKFWNNNNKLSPALLAEVNARIQGRTMTMMMTTILCSW